MLEETGNKPPFDQRHAAESHQDHTHKCSEGYHNPANDKKYDPKKTTAMKVKLQEEHDATHQRNRGMQKTQWPEQNDSEQW